MRAEHLHTAARGRGGYATMLALLTVVLLGVCITATATSFAGDVKRQRARVVGAQLDQLLLAGGYAAPQHVEALAAGRTVALELPADLATRATVELTAREGSDDVLVVRVTARLASHTAAQTLTLIRDGGGWRVAQARLE